jgi:GrpB-like predicted nucleotidyltransferase (UPF0157 family)
VPFADESAVAAPVPYRASWPADFEVVAARLRAALGGLALAVDHVGSTSVPGLPAKDCVDVQVRVSRVDDPDIVTALAAAGFRLRDEEWNLAETSFGVTSAKRVFAPPAGGRASNVHIRAFGGPGARFALLFRDYLRADAGARDAWGEFKVRLAAEVPDLLAYGQVKQPATRVLMGAAIRWAAETGWTPS